MAAAVMQMESPVGRLTLVASAGQLSGVFWESERERVPSVPDGHMPQPQDAALLRQASVQLDEYFAGRRTRFDLPLAMAGTPFQEAVWRALLDIPYGEVRSYGDLAWKIGRPSAARAVGAANGRNPLSIIVPCHRVVGQDGTLTGFAGGLSAKHRLLRLEGHWLDSAETAQARLLTGPVAAQLELGI